ncbi:MAG: hypothetical protein H2069_06360 [Legionella sp.]|nr:hypothetical protein [Legionella sp.]
MKRIIALLMTTAFMSAAFASDNRPLGGTMTPDNNGMPSTQQGTDGMNKNMDNMGKGTDGTMGTSGNTGTPGSSSGSSTGTQNNNSGNTTTPPTNTGTGGY